MNWKAEATEKLRRYGAMRLAAINLPQEIRRLQLDARSIRSARTDSMPVSGGGNQREEALLNNLIQRQELDNTLKQANLWLKNTDRAMGILSPEEKQILHKLLIYPQKHGVEQLCQELGMEQSTIYRKRDEALRRFTLAYYGICEL